MKKLITVGLSLLFGMITIAQVSTRSGIFLAKEFSKEIALYKAKDFVMNEVLGPSKQVIKFEINALAAASSGELTSLVYKCDDLNKEGLVLGFYGDRWNDQGVSYQAYAFKHIPADKAIELLNILDSITTKYLKYTSSNSGTNNAYFHYDDITFLIYYGSANMILRVFWNGFDSEWEWSAIAKTQKKLLKKL